MSTALIRFGEAGELASRAAVSLAMFLPNAAAAERFFEFVRANILNGNTWRAYDRAACRFSDWCVGRGLGALGQVEPMHIAAYIEWLALPAPEGPGLATPTVKQQLAAIRMLFD